MTLLILSFIAGVLTVAAPCILPLLPVIIGGSLVPDARDTPNQRWLRPLVITASLALSVVTFTLLIKGTTALLGIPQGVWRAVSGGIVLLLGINYLWPHGWERLAAASFIRSNQLLGSAARQHNFVGSVLVGTSLGPVFSSCSPTYALIVATVLPSSFAQGMVYLLAYAAGLSITLLLIAYIGQAFTAKLRWLSNPKGTFKTLLGFTFIAVGIAVLFGLDKDLQTFVLEQGWYDPISNFEQQLRK